MYWLDFSPISEHFILPAHVDLVSAPQSKNTVKEITVSMINHVVVYKNNGKMTTTLPW